MMKKIILNLIQFIIGAILIFSIVVVVFPFLPPFRGFYHTRAVLTGSMEPAVKKGSLIVNKWIEDRDIRKGDIVTFRKPTERNVFITHRIEKVKKTEPLYRFHTKGDANEASDFWEITQANIEGKVIFTIPFLGYLIEFFKTPVGFILVVVLPLLIFIIKEILQTRKIYQEIKAKGKKKPKEKKKKIKTKKKILSAIIIISLLLSSRIQGTFALFSSNTVSMASVTLQTAATFSSSDDSRPSSEITSTESLFNSHDFQIDYDANDNALDYVELWYSFNYGDWQHFGDNRPHSPGSFIFTSPEGDGVYEFITVAVDEAGNVEDKDSDEIDDNAGQEALNGAYGVIGEPAIIQVDTELPTMNLSLDNSSDWWAGQNLLESGDFEKGMGGWVAGGEGDHHITFGPDFNPALDDNNELFLLGFKDADLAENARDWLYQDVDLPASLSANLVFDWRMVSEDTVDYDWFSVFIKEGNDDGNVLDNILKTGSGEIFGTSAWSGDSDWRNINYPLLGFAGKKIRIWFETVNSQGPDWKSWVYLDNVQVTTTDNRITEDKEVNFEIHDASGSGEFSNDYSIDGVDQGEYSDGDLGLASGDHQIDYSAEDNAGNISATKSADLVVLPSQPDIVINKFLANPLGTNTDRGDTDLPLDGEWVELYNNSDTEININGWYLYDSDDDHELEINSTNVDTDNDLSDTNDLPVVLAHGWLRIYRNSDGDFSLNNDGDEIRLYNGQIGDTGVELIDQFIYQNDVADGEIWQRSPDGIGSWELVEPGIDVHITSRYAKAHKILLSIFNISDDYGKGDLLKYEIIYNDGSEGKGIAGTILPETVEDNKADREFYLGTCSTGVCVPDVVKNKKINLIVTQGTTEIIDSDFDI